MSGPKRSRKTMSSFLPVLVLCLCLEAVQSRNLTYALFTAGPSGGFVSSGAVPAIELAEKLINEDSSILPGYILTHTPVADTRCDRTTSLNQYFDTISLSSPTILGLLGCGCSLATTPVAEIVQHNSISQIAYASSSIELSDRTRFPNFFRTYPSDADFTPATVALIQYYGWERIVFLTQDEDLFTEVASRVRGALRQVDIDAEIRNIRLLSNLKSSGFFLEEDDHRVFFLNTFSDLGRRVICEAYLRGYTYPRYAWLTYGWYQDSWWTEEVNPEPIDCTDEQLAEFLEKSLVVQLFPKLNDPNAITDVRLTPQQFYTMYKTRLQSPEAQANNYTYIFLATVAYDALWTFALALNRTSEMVEGLTREEVLNMTQCEGFDQRTGMQWELVSLENFTYSNELMGCVIRWNLQRTDFVGVSGPVKFDSNGTSVLAQVEIFQYRALGGSVTSNLTRVPIGRTIRQDRGNVTVFTYQNGENNGTVFPSGIPLDGTPIEETITYHLGVVVTFHIMAAAGMVFCTVCLIFNFTQRNKKVVKLTSPNINYLIIIGAYLVYLSIIFRLMPSTDYSVNEARCILDTLLDIIGYSLAFSAILVKMGRVYYIFDNPSLGKKVLKDWKLVLIALGIAGVGVILALLQVIVPQFRPIPQLVPVTEVSPEDNRNEFGIRIELMVYKCFVNTAQDIWLGITFAYLIMLQIIGIVLAIQTRKVKIKLLNDSKYIAALIYISSLSLVVIVIATIVPSTVINAVESITSACLWIAMTSFLALVFIPKMVSLYRDPTGEYVLSEGANQTTGNVLNFPDLSHTRTSTLGEEEKAELQDRIMKLENRLREYEVTTSALTESTTANGVEPTVTNQREDQ